jgi:hypothetical protein
METLNSPVLEVLRKRMDAWRAEHDAKLEAEVRKVAAGVFTNEEIASAMKQVRARRTGP